MATATKTPENVYQKLLKARSLFLKSEVQKTGKNMNLSFKYFELDDINNLPSYEELLDAMKTAVLSVTGNGCAGFFKHCGYCVNN